MIRRPPRSTQSRSSAASDVYKRQVAVRVLSVARAVSPGRAALIGQAAVRGAAAATAASDHQRQPEERDDARRGGAIIRPVSYTHLRAHETRHDLVCRLLLEKKQ